MRQTSSIREETVGRQWAERLASLGANVFAAMDTAKQQARQAGLEVIDLSLGSSDLAPPPAVLTAIQEALRDPETYGYNLFASTAPFREAVARWYERKFGLGVDPETEVLPLIGSQEGTGHLPLAVLNPGDYALLTDPGYPSHGGGVALAGGIPYWLPLRAERGFVPDLVEIPPEIAQASRLMVLSYPHNPTTAVASLGFWQEAVGFCQHYDLILAHDFPYVDWVFDGGLPPSVLQADPEKQVSIEFFSLSKSFHMGGFRVGYAIGNAEVIRALRQVKAAIDFNQYQGILRGAAVALEQEWDFPKTSLAVYRQRRDVAVAALAEIGWQVPTPPATMYVWMPLPPIGLGSMEFCLELVRQTGVALAPGSGFGQQGEGYVRLALVADPPRLRTAVERIGSFLADWAD